MATRDGLWFAEHIGLNRIIIQSDNKVVVQNMNGGGFSATSSPSIFHHYNLRASSFDEVKFVHSPRETNTVAHEVARSVSLLSEACTWVIEP